ALLAETYMKAGRTDKALEAIDTALSSRELPAGYFYAAEIYRLKGELLIQRGNDPSAGEACLRQAMTLAREQNATSLELRSAISLSTLLDRQGDRRRARRL